MALVFFAVLTLFCAQSAASITPTGSIDPAYDSSDPWVINIGDEFIVGFEAPGSLSITAGSDVTANMPVYIGDYAEEVVGATGTFLLTGLGSTFSVDPAGESMLFIGPRSEGDLTVTNQAILTSHDAIIGGSPAEGESEEVTEVVEGLGYATVSGGGQWSLGDGSWLTVGAAGQGELAITGEGSAVTANTSEVALLPNSSGDVLVDDSGSWSLTEDLVVGVWGAGSLTVSGGGQVQSARGWVGGVDRTAMNYEEPIFDGLGEPNGTGEVIVTGENSRWDAGDVLVVGAWGTGTLDVNDQGAVTAADVYIGGMPIQLGEGQEFSRDLLPDGTGTVTVSGEGSVLEVLSEETLYVGYSGAGTLNVEAGGEVTSGTVVIGAAPDALGAVVVTGEGSTLNAEDIQVGAWGTGSLTISDGGTVSADYMAIGGMDASDVDELPEAMLDDFGDALGVGTVTVTGDGSLLEVLGDDTLIVGSYGTGTLNVEAGGDVVSVKSFIGGYAEYEDVEETEIATIHPGTGTVTVTGEGSTWESEMLYVGAGGEGTLNVQEGGVVGSNLAVVGLGPDGAGTVTVHGSGSLWDVTDAGDFSEELDGVLIVGAWGEGELNVEAGGRVNAVTLYVGGTEASEVAVGVDWGLDDPAGTGTVTVTGAGSVLSVLPGEGEGGDPPLTTYVGYSGEGTLNILDGGRVESDAAVVGVLEGSTGLVNVDGEDSTWSIQGGGGSHLGMTAEGEGNVVVSNGGLVAVEGFDAALIVADDVTVGSEGEGTLTVTNGGKVFSDTVILGGADPDFDSIAEYLDPDDPLDAGTGTALVSGPGSLLETEDMHVGFSGTGELTISNGGQVIDESAWIGVLPDAVGTVLVTEAESTWSNTEHLIVGAWGLGDLTISGGGYVSAPEVFIGGASFDAIGEDYDPNLVPEGTGTITVTGADSQLEVTGYATLYVGYSGTGTLNVDSGGDVMSESVVIGAAPDAEGTVLVTGAGSTLTTEDMTIGAWGTGTLTVADGAEVTADYLTIGGFDASDVDDLPQEVLDEFGDGLGTGVVTVMGDGSSLSVTGDYPLLVGYFGTGTLTASEGGLVESDSLMVGAAPDATGTVTIDDAELAIAGSAAVGAWGQGNLTVSGGSEASVGTLYIGGFDPDEAPPELVELFGDPAGTGTVVVTGAGSVLDVTEDNTVYVGYSGDGTLEILNGGQVNSHSGVVGVLGGSNGQVVVDGHNSLWQITGGETAPGLSAQGDGDVTIANNAQIDVDGTDGPAVLDVAGTITVGAEGEVSFLEVHNGAKVYSEAGIIGGYDPDFDTLEQYFDEDPPGLTDGIGWVEVIGAGSEWDTEELMVGFSGNGTLLISADGVVTDDRAWVGVTPEATGDVDVLTGSTWVNYDELAVGIWGSGVVDILGGSDVWAADVYIGGVPLDLLGEDVPEELIPDGAGMVNVTGEGSALHVTEYNSLYVGYYGDGILDVSSGGLVESDVAGVGVMPGSTGAVTVSGGSYDEEEEGFSFTPSTWHNDAFVFVGGYGEGSLTVMDGGLVDIENSLYVGGFDPDRFGFDTELVGYEPNGTGTVIVTGEGSTLYGTGLEELYVGYSGDGTLSIEDGGYVESGVTAIGLLPDSTGAVTVDGVAGDGEGDVSLWENLGSIVVGGYGDGTLTVSNGGEVYSSELYIGGYDPDSLPFDVGEIDSYPDGTGAVTVTGEGSYFETEVLVAGVTGDGTLNVLAGGEVESEAGIVAFGPDSVGNVVVNGDGSTWTLVDLDEEEENWSILGVGIYGTGQLTVSNGGQVTVADAVVGGFDLEDLGMPQYYDLFGDPNGNGTINVTGLGSLLDVEYELCIGHSGLGTLLISNGGRVNTGDDAFVGDEPNGVGAVSVTGAAEEPSQWVISDDLYVGGYGTGALTISDGGEVITDEDAFIGYGESGSGTVVVTGEDSIWMVGEQLYVGGHEEGAAGDGSLYVNDGGQVTVWDEMYVWETGLVGGDGTITVMNPTTLHNYGTIAPGDDGIGTLTIEGSVVFHEGSTFAVDINNTTSDRLTISGEVTIEGGTVQVSSEGTIIGEHSYQILDGYLVNGEFDVLDTALLDFTVVDANLTYPGSSVWLYLTAEEFNDPNVAQTYNQRQVAGALQDIGEEGGNDVTDAVQDLETADDVRGAYDQLSGQTRPPLAPMTIAGSSKFLGTVTSRVQTVKTGLVAGAFDSKLLAAAGPDQALGGSTSRGGQDFAVGNGTSVLADKRWGLWGRGYGLYGDRDSGDELPGYGYHIFGGSFGVDYQFTETLLAGLVAGVSEGDVDFDNSRDNTDFGAAHIGLYGSLAWDVWNVDAVATYASLDYETRRFVDLLDERLSGNFDGSEFAAYVEVSRDYELAPNLTLAPLASVQYTYLDLDSYTETGGVSALAFESQTHESIRGSLGARLTKRLIETAGDFRADVQLRGRWVHEFGDDRASVDTSFASDPTVVFTVKDDAISRDSAVLGLGFLTELNDRTRAYFDYDTRLNSDETVHVFSASLQYRW